MRHIGKKILSVVLAAALSVSSLALTASAEGETTTATATNANMGTKWNLTEMGNSDWMHPYNGGVDRKVGVPERIGWEVITEPSADSTVSWFSGGNIL